MRTLWLIYWIVFPFKITAVQTIINAGRFSLLAFSSTIFFKKWSASTLFKIGHIFMWIGRFWMIIVALQQAFANHEDPQVMTALVAILCCCGVVIPSFTEYLCFVLTLPLIRPALIYLASPDGFHNDHFQQVLFQHALILMLALSVTWTVHADSRRNWLRSPASSGLHPSTALCHADARRSSKAGGKGDRIRGGSNKSSITADAPAVSGSMEELDDGYFTEEDMREDAERTAEVGRAPPFLRRIFTRRARRCNHRAAGKDQGRQRGFVGGGGCAWARETHALRCGRASRSGPPLRPGSRARRTVWGGGIGPTP